MYIQGMAVQTQIFLQCVGFGFCLGAVYDMIKFIRKSFSRSRRAVVIQDIFCFIVYTVLCFFFLLCINNGEFRLYALTGLAIGFFIYYFTLGALLSGVLNKASGAIYRFNHYLKGKIKKICGQSSQKIKKLLKNNKKIKN